MREHESFITYIRRVATNFWAFIILACMFAVSTASMAYAAYIIHNILTEITVITIP